MTVSVFFHNFITVKVNFIQLKGSLDSSRKLPLGLVQQNSATSLSRFSIRWFNALSSDNELEQKILKRPACGCIGRYAQG